MCAAADSFLDLDISCVLVVDDRLWFVLRVVWIPRIGFIQLVSMGFRLHLLFHFSSSSALQLIVRSFVRSQHSFLSSNIHYLLFHDRPLSSSHHAKVRLSLACVTSFFDLCKPSSTYASHSQVLR